MDADAADMLRRLEADIRPGPAGIGRSVDAVAVGDVEPDGGLPGARVDHVGVGARHRDGADRGASHEAVRDAPPIHAAVDRLPDAAGAGAEIEHHLVHGIARDGDDAAAARRADAPPLQATEIRGRRNACRGRHEGNRSVSGKKGGGRLVTAIVETTLREAGPFGVGVLPEPPLPAFVPTRTAVRTNLHQVPRMMGGCGWDEPRASASAPSWAPRGRGNADCARPLDIAPNGARRMAKPGEAGGGRPASMLVGRPVEARMIKTDHLIVSRFGPQPRARRGPRLWFAGSVAILRRRGFLAVTLESTNFVPLCRPRWRSSQPSPARPARGEGRAPGAQENMCTP